jgi:hypothetical protein
VFKKVKRAIKKMFREFLVYHHSSMEYRAKILTLMVSSNGKMCECEIEILRQIAHSVYGDDTERAEILVDTVSEYHNKIITNNGLNFEHLIQLVERESKEVLRFTDKIDMAHLALLYDCTAEGEEKIFQLRILTFLQNLKDEYGKIY